MIIPTAEYNPMFANDGVPFQEKMADYIKAEFGEILAGRAGLLHSDEGLASLAALYASAARTPSQTRKAA